MKNYFGHIFAAAILTTILTIAGFAQNTSSTPAPQSAPRPQATPSVQNADQMRSIMRGRETLNQRFEVLRNLERRSKTPLIRTGVFENITNIYRKPTKEEFKLLAPENEDLQKYAQFLKQSDTGLVKLLLDRGCAEFTTVIDVSDKCLKYTMPGAGSSYSFRTKNYRIRRLSDLTYTDDGFQSLGFISHALLVKLGDIPLEQVSLQTNGLNFLTEFKTVTDYEKAKQTDKEITDGIEKDGFFYSRRAEAQENMTYALRSIAYRANFYRALQGIVYDEFDFDERRDVIIAFRIVQSDDESVTILWKKIADEKTPFIKKPDEDKKKIEENKFTAEKDLPVSN